jgi:hypothetical protein
MEVAWPTRALGIAFTVVDDRKKEFEAQRPDDDVDKKRRFILWTKALNFNAQKEGYLPEMSDLQHPSAFLQDLRHSHTTTGDLTLAYYQHELTLSQRALCRFYNNDGELLQSTRGVMGALRRSSRSSPVFSGDPRLCTVKHTLQVPTPDVD